jgi:raffinose/stachyose/melibiose transport system permease protein
VTIVSLALIILLGSLAAYALAMWRSRWSTVIYIFFIAGLMIPIRLGTINIFQIIQSMGLTDSVFSLIPVYIAMGLPISVFVLTTFIRGLPGDLIDAAHVDGAGELRIYWSVIMPLIRPAVATVVIFNLIPVWNDLWFPLIFIRAEDQRTVILGVSLLFGQYQTNWTRILSALSMAAIPILILYLLMSKQFIKGLTAGAVKG